MSGGQEFDDLLETLKGKLVSANSFSALTASCDGAFPARIVDLLHYLALTMAAASERLAEAEQPDQVQPFSDHRLPLPHPQDFEWRYSNASIDGLLRTLNAIAGHSGRVLFVCTPAIALRAFDVQNPRHLIYASRMDDAVTESLKAVCGERLEFIDVRDDLAGVAAAAAVVDPPWYDDIALPLVTQAVAGLEEGGGLLVGLPDRLSGCSSASLLSSIAADAKPFGMERAELLSGRVRYETPYFELNTFRALGLGSVHPQWRTGRVAFGRRTRRSVPHYPFPPCGSWYEIGKGPWRMRVRARSANQFARSERIRFEIRDGVSRTANGRKEEQCWTVGNRVAYVDDRAADLPLGGKLNAFTVPQIMEIELSEVREQLTDRDALKTVTEKHGITLPIPEVAIYSGQDAW